MRLVYDRNKIQETIDAKGYDERNLTICKCGKHRYPSKLMFIRFLEQFPELKGVADIWSENDCTTGKIKIHVDVEYQWGFYLQDLKIPNDEIWKWRKHVE